MSIASQQPMSMSQVQRQPGPSGLADVLEILLDKGLVVDVYVRVSLVGIELLTIDARIVVASVDTYLRFAEAVNRLDLTQVNESKTLPDMFGDANEDGANRRTKGVLEGAKEALFGGGDDDDEDDDDGGGNGRSRSRTTASKRSTARKSSSARKTSSSRSRASSGSRGR